MNRRSLLALLAASPLAGLLPKPAAAAIAVDECGFGSLTSQRGDRLIIDDPHSCALTWPYHPNCRCVINAMDVYAPGELVARSVTDSILGPR